MRFDLDAKEEERSIRRWGREASPKRGANVLLIMMGQTRA
jgi:hypothetical protein